MIIKREKALDKLLKSRDNDFVKIITGVRRCGKSYLLFNLFANQLKKEGIDEKHMISVQLDDDDMAELRTPRALSAWIKARLPKDRRKTYVFIDEIQMCVPPREEIGKPDCVTFYDILNTLRKKKNLDVYVTGSNSHLLSSDVATEFRGRGQAINLTPLSFAEFYSLKKKSVHPWEVLREYMIFGGLPACALLSGEEERKNYLKDLYQTIYLRDIVDRYDIRDDTVLNAVIDVVMSSVGGLTNPTKLADTINSVAKIPCARLTVSKYLGYLENAFLISKASRFDVRGKRYIDHLSKYYAEDTGLRNVRMNFRQVEFTHLMENVVYNELRRNGYSVDVGVVITGTNKSGKHIRTASEIDFVVNRGYDRLYIQSAWMIPDGEKMKQETFSLRNTNDSFRKLVIDGSPISAKYIDNDGIGHIGVIDFLLDPASIENL